MEHNRYNRDEAVFRNAGDSVHGADYTPDLQLLSALIQSLPLNVFAKDREGTFIFANDFYCKNVGKTYGELIGKNDFEVHPVELAEKYRKDDRRIMELCRTESIEETWQSIGGEQTYIQVIKSPLFHHYDREEVIGIVGIFWDITDRKKAEIELAEERYLLRTMIDLVPGYFYIKDRESRFLVANETLTRFMGVDSPDDLLGRTDHDFFPKKDADEFRRDECMVVEGEKPLLNKEEYITNHLDKKEWVLTSKLPLRNLEGAVVGLVGMGLNITERKEEERRRKRLEEQLVHAQKMETVGTLAGGLAHDLNNLLMGIQGHASLIDADIDSGHPFRLHVKGIEEYVKSATALTSQLLGFARGGKYEVIPTALNDLIEKTAEMFSRTHKEIRLVKAFNPDLCVVEADNRQIEQVLLNMFINAWQAMPGGGDLYLKTDNTTLDETQAAMYSLSPRMYAKISITDTGVGMDQATQQRIFDPFFTTKALGRGTGMGLASAYGIIQNHGGIITVYSEPNHGSTFNIYLPSSDKAARAEVVQEDEVVQGSGTILIVDDESMITDIGKAMLEKLGYCAITAPSGARAVEIVSEAETKIDLAILDLIMPGMDGGKTFDRIREIRPKLPIILSSGYSINGEASNILKRGANSFIQKPFKLSELSLAIRKILCT